MKSAIAEPRPAALATPATLATRAATAVIGRRLAALAPVVVVLGVTSGCATQMTPPTDGGGEPDRAGTAPRELPPTPLDTIDTNSGLHSRATEAVVQALAQLGTPYRWGGESANHGFDCSGLTQYAYQAANISLPRTSYRQYRATRRVDRQALRPGDLVFFHLNGRRIDHVGIYVGGKRFVHAPSTGKTVSFARLDNPFWSRRYAGGGRAPEASILQLAEHLSNDR